MASPVRLSPAAARHRRRWWSVVPLAVAGAIGVGLGLTAIPVTAVWMTSPGTTASWIEPVGLTVATWVVAHDVPVSIDRSVYSLLPWGLCVVWALLCAKSGRWAARRCRVEGLREGATIVLALAGCYAIVVATLTWVMFSATMHASPIRAFGIAFVVAAVGGLVGVLRGGGLTAQAVDVTPPAVRSMLTAALGGVLVLVAGSAVLLAVALALGFSSAERMLVGLNAGPVGGLVLLLVSIGYLPVGVMWVVAYVLGTPVMVGGDVTVSAFADAGGQVLLPSLPMLAAIPERAFPGAWALPALGLVAGLVMGRLAARGGAALLARVAIAVGAALLGALVLSILARVSTGSLGHLQLVGLGPSSQAVAQNALLAFIVGALPAAALPRRRGSRPNLRPVPSAPSTRFEAGAATVVEDDSQSADATVGDIDGHIVGHVDGHIVGDIVTATPAQLDVAEVQESQHV